MLSWRETIDPYRIWLSEVILQQTRVQQYNEIQKRCNEDRLVSVIDGKVSNMLIINDKYAQIIYMGVHADEALEQIRQSKDFARKTSEGEILDIVFGKFQP